MKAEHSATGGAGAALDYAVIRRERACRIAQDALVHDKTIDEVKEQHNASFSEVFTACLFSMAMISRDDFHSIKRMKQATSELLRQACLEVASV